MPVDEGASSCEWGTLTLTAASNVDVDSPDATTVNWSEFETHSPYLSGVPVDVAMYVGEICHLTYAKSDMGTYWSGPAE